MEQARVRESQALGMSAGRSRRGRRAWGGVFLALALAMAVALTARAATNFNVGAQGMSAYVINAANNPTLNLVRGQSYTFTVTVPGHPFWIVSAPGAGEVNTNAFNTGVTNNGASPGTLTFDVPASAPSTLFYQCSFHDPMVGTIKVTSPSGVPAISAALAVLLGGLLLVLAVALMRRAPRPSAAPASCAGLGRRR
jgi:hypothetical protein